MSVTAVFFGNLRMIGIAAGLIMVPLTTFFMIGSIIFLFVQPLLPFLELPFHFGLSVLYMLLEKISGYAAKAPALPVFNMPLFVILSSILPLAVIYFCILRLKVRNNIEKFD